MDFTGKVVLVTGSSRGIGRAIAQQFAAAGARVVVHYVHDRPAAEQTLVSLVGDSHLLLQADLKEPNQAQYLVNKSIQEMGQIDILINNAGMFTEHRILDIPYQEWLRSWQDTIAVNLFGPANVTYWVVQQMKAQGGGRIVNVSSRGAFRGEPDAPAYGASKAGLNAMSQSLAKALAPENIFVCVVAPGWVDTDMAVDALKGPDGEAILNQSPLKRVATADEVARTVLFLSSEGTDFLTGCIVDVNGASYLRM